MKLNERVALVTDDLGARIHEAGFLLGALALLACALPAHAEGCRAHASRRQNPMSLKDA